MKVFFDDQIYLFQNYGGISRYFYELSKGLTERKNEVINSVFLTNNRFVNRKLYHYSQSYLPNINFKGKVTLGNAINRCVTKTLLKYSDYDIFHPTYYDAYFVNHIKAKPVVVTFHDHCY